MGDSTSGQIITPSSADEALLHTSHSHTMQSYQAEHVMLAWQQHRCTSGGEMTSRWNPASPGLVQSDPVMAGRKTSRSPSPNLPG